MLVVESSKVGFSLDMFWDTIEKFKYGYYFLITLFEGIFFLVFGMYIDMVWPSEIGVRKHPLFCLGFPRKKKTTRHVND